MLITLIIHFKEKLALFLVYSNNNFSLKNDKLHFSSVLSIIAMVSSDKANVWDVINSGLKPWYFGELWCLPS